MTEEAQAVAEEVSEPTVEDKAAEQGWRPQEEWEGDPSDWVDAKQFIFRGELMDRIKTQTKQLHRQDSEIATLKSGFQEFQAHATKLAEAEFKEKLAKLKDVKKQALEDNDYDTVVEADEQMADLKTEQKEAPAQPEQQKLDPEVLEWLDDNQWYNDDLAMKGAADAIADQIRSEKPDAPIREILTEVGAKIKERFAKPTRSNNNPITPSSSSQAPKKRVLGKADLNEEQLRVGQRFVKMGAVASLKEYAKQLDEIGEIQR